MSTPGHVVTVDTVDQLDGFKFRTYCEQCTWASRWVHESEYPGDPIRAIAQARMRAKIFGADHTTNTQGTST